MSLVLAAAIAYVNARSSAQLAARYPTSGGTYAYGREVLGPWAGFIAGWGFVIGKIASAAAMALTFATYTVPEGWVKPVAALAVSSNWPGSLSWPVSRLPRTRNWTPGGERRHEAHSVLL